MWRLCDLHNHTLPNEQCQDVWDAAAFVQSRRMLGLNLIAVTDHDHVDRVEELMVQAADTELTVVPGVELSTDRGHLLILAPGENGIATLRQLLVRVGAAPGTQVAFEEVMKVTERRPYTERLVLVGAHVNQPGSLLASSQALSREGQLQLVAGLHALEVSDDSVFSEWNASGVKQGPRLTLVRGSDCHDPSDLRLRATWIYLPEITPGSFQHAFAMPEASVMVSSNAPKVPDFVIESIRFTGGHHDGVTFEWCERTNAIIGPPNAGKSLIIDAIKFVFGLRSELAEVESISQARMAKCLPSGCVVEVRVRTPSGSVPLTRTLGAAQPPAPPFRPIVFSQTELTRRAIASTPAMSLLDMHFPEADARKSEIVRTQEVVAELFETALCTTAEQAMELRSRVSNSIDGLAATRAELEKLAGSETVAKRATAAISTATWRSRVREEVELWCERACLTPLELSEPPAYSVEEASLQTFVPKATLDAVVADAVNATAVEVERVTNRIIETLEADDDAFAAMQRSIEQELADAGYERGSELEAQLGSLRSRLAALEAHDRELQKLDARIDTNLVNLRDRHDCALAARQALAQGRKHACRTANTSMRTFFARVDEGGDVAAVDQLIGDLATGTFMRGDTRKALRESLDRFALLETAVRRLQGTRTGPDDEDNQERVVAEALGKGRRAELARLSCLWPEDTLVLARKGNPPTPFEGLTEGLRALAIKEISFASSGLPVITDQPEDAVPTRSVFESIVPTFREQRRHRQFIVISHDANIVVASDVDRIAVLQANDDGSPHVGDLFDSRVRDAALEHLEGGSKAFRLRAERYASLGDTDT
jgi:hypothetical protein